MFPLSLEEIKLLSADVKLTITLPGWRGKERFSVQNTWQVEEGCSSNEVDCKLAAEYRRLCLLLFRPSVLFCRDSQILRFLPLTLGPAEPPPVDLIFFNELMRPPAQRRSSAGGQPFLTPSASFPPTENKLCLESVRQEASPPERLPLDVGPSSSSCWWPSLEEAAPSGPPR